MAIREYTCNADGYFTVRRPISAPLQETCPKCGARATQTFTKAPMFGFKGDGIPNDSKDEAGYEGWQRETWAKFEDKLHVDNAGTKDVPLKKLIKKTGTGKGR